MARIDHLISLLSLNSIRFDSMSSGDGKPELDMMIVNAALGMGKLSEEAELLGRAIHLQDEVAASRVRDIAAMRVRNMFKENNWSTTKPFQNHIKSYLANGSVTEAQVPEMKIELARRLFRCMANLAISELEADGDCLTCDGRGYLRNKRTCGTCNGARKAEWIEQYKADFCVSIQIEAWHKRWKWRYRDVLMELKSWLVEFEEHLLGHCA